MATEIQERKIEGIVGYLTEYLNLRFEQACRVNPGLKRVQIDLTWRQMREMRQVLASAKGFGPDRFCIADILSGFDEEKREALFSLKDQNSVYTEIVTESKGDNEGIEARGIRDLGSLYRTLDPSMEKAVLLIQTWIWWDFRDALDLNRLDLQRERIRALARATINQKLRDYYRLEMPTPPPEITLTDILAFEFARMSKIPVEFSRRRDADPGYQIIIAQEQLDSETLDSQVVIMGRALRVIEKVSKSGDLDPKLRERYAKTLKCSPEEVTAEAILSREKDTVDALRHSLRRTLELEEDLGEPFNFKRKQQKGAEGEVAEVEAIIRQAVPDAAQPTDDAPQ